MATMDILLNGADHAIAPACTLAQLLAEAGLGDRRVAVEVNGTIVPRAAHGRYILHAGDRVEIVHALGGG
jgi:sulfur carrier protein